MTVVKDLQLLDSEAESSALEIFDALGRPLNQEGVDLTGQSVRPDSPETGSDGAAASEESSSLTIQWELNEDAQSMGFYFPYGKDTLEMRLIPERITYYTPPEGKNKGKNYSGGGQIRTGDFILGFPEIYSRIPEFMEN